MNLEGLIDALIFWSPILICGAAIYGIAMWADWSARRAERKSHR